MRIGAGLMLAMMVCPILRGQTDPTPQADTPAYKPPAYQNLRQNEDWSVLAGRETGTSADFFDPFKYVPLSAGEAIWVSFGGQLRERVESWNQFNFGAPATAVHNDGFLLSRLLLHTDLHLGEHVRVFVQEKNALETHRALLGGRRTSEEDDLDIENGFVDIRMPFSDNSNFTFRAGRQELLFGKQRFVGPSDWTNTRRTFDGFSGSFGSRTWNVTGFWTRPVKILKYDFDPSDHSTAFYGVHSTGKVPRTGAGLDLYWYELRHASAVYNGTSGRERRHTLGGHAYGLIAKSGFDYDLGGGYQFGAVGVRDISAFMAIVQLGYSFLKLRTIPRVYVGFDYASGSRTKGGDVGTYNQLFPTAHSTFGYMDAVGRQNGEDLSAGLALKPMGKLSAALDVHNLWRADATDALYDKRGAVLRPGAAGTSARTGVETDLTFKYQLDRHTMLEAGYGHFFPGEFIQQSGPHRPEDFAYLSFQYTF